MSAFLLGGTFTATTFSLASPPAAQAFDAYGPGIKVGGLHIGAYIHSDGEYVYCVDMPLDASVGTTAPALQTVNELPGKTLNNAFMNGKSYPGLSYPALKGDGLAELNYLLAKYGSTNNNDQAAAVGMAVWKVRLPGSSESYQEMYRDFVAMAPAADARATQMIAEAKAAVQAAKSSNSDAGPFTIKPHPSNPYKGTVVIPKGASEVTITNGVFDSTGGAKLTWPDGAPAGTEVAWSGRPPYNGTSWDRYYRVSFDGFYLKQQIDSKVQWNTRPGYVQDGVRWSADKPTTKRLPLTGAYVDPDTLWSPVLSTETPAKKVKRGEAFSDTVTFGVAQNSRPWREAESNGRKFFAPIKARGTLYGPFLQDPALNPSGTPPKGAPIAATAEVQTSLSKGPGTYEVNNIGTAKEAGYYTWVWNIEFEEQFAEVKAPAVSTTPSIPTNYFFTDGFGKVTEGQHVPTELTFSTTLAKNQVGLMEQVTDDVNVSLRHGGWLQGEDGNRIPFTLTGTVYGTDSKPVQQPSAPADATVIDKLSMTVDGEGVYTSGSFKVPASTKSNWLTVQWCVVDNDQTDAAKGKVEEWCDDFGVPSETAEILRPTVTTKAQPAAGLYEDFFDTAIVDGFVPEQSEVVFDLYKKIQAGDRKYDADGNKTDELWTEDEVKALGDNAVCTVQNRVTRTDRIAVQTGQNDNREYQSPNVSVTQPGTYWWVETLITQDPEEGEVTIHEGECGLPNETTVVELPKVSTKALPAGAYQGDIYDVAIVSGSVPKSENRVSFELFVKPEAGAEKVDENWNKTGETWTQEEIDALGDTACEVQRVATTEPVAVDKAGEYRSPNVVAKTIGTTYWVETFETKNPETGEWEQLHRGKCGIPEETTVVENPKVSTKATTEAVAGETIFDTAIVEGLLSERAGIKYDVTFEAFHVTDTQAAELCTTATKVWETKEPTVVTGVGEFKSELFQTTEEHVGKIYWVETLWITDEGGKREQLHRGECGAKDEITTVKQPLILAMTGGLNGWLAPAGVLLLLAAGTVGVFAYRSRKHEPENAE